MTRKRKGHMNVPSFRFLVTTSKAENAVITIFRKTNAEQPASARPYQRTWHSNFRYRWFRARSLSLPSLGAFGGMVLVRQARQRGTFRGVFLQLSFLLRYGASSLALVSTSFWNPAISGKVSRSAEFECNQAYGVCTVGAPKQVEEGFCWTKSAKSAPSLQSLA
jgi:hypothetical protein